MGLWDDVDGCSEIVAHLLNTLLIKVVIEPLPIEVHIQEALCFETSADHLDLQVRNREFLMLGYFVVLLHNNDAFLEEVLVDLPSFLLRDEHH
jgi:hypothetical protein